MELHRMYHHDRAYPRSFGKWRTTIVWIRIQRTTPKGNFLDGKFVERCPIIAWIFLNAYLIPILLLLIVPVINLSNFLIFIWTLFEFLFRIKQKKKKCKRIFSCQRVNGIFYCKNQIAGRLSAKILNLSKNILRQLSATVYLSIKFCLTLLKRHYCVNNSSFSNMFIRYSKKFSCSQIFSVSKICFVIDICMR